MATESPIRWDAQGVPHSVEFRDKYFCTQNGYEESHLISTKGNDLQNRFFNLDTKRKGTFVVIETGFGTGLSFCCLWELWDRCAPRSWTLRFISIELYPLPKEDIDRALSIWPLVKYQRALVAQYEAANNQTRHFYFNDQKVHLTIVFKDVVEALKEIAEQRIAEGKADAWLLNGFSPFSNPKMWSTEVFQGMKSLSKQGSTLSTFTVAGSVRRGLEEQGFIRRTNSGVWDEEADVEGDVSFMNVKRMTWILFFVICVTTPCFAQQERITVDDAVFHLFRNGVSVEIPNDKKQVVINQIVALLNSCIYDTSQPELREVWEKEGLTIEQLWNTIKDGSYLSLRYPEISPVIEIIERIYEDKYSLGTIMARLNNGEIRGYIKCSGLSSIQLFCLPELLPYLPEAYQHQEKECKNAFAPPPVVKSEPPKPLPAPVSAHPDKRISKVYYGDGRVYSETDLFADRYNGFYKTFHPNGQLATEVRYKDNHQVYDKAFDEQGRPLFRNGMVREYYAGSNILACEAEYRHDQKNGKQVCYYYDGKTVVDIWHYMNGRRVGAHIRNDASGNFVSEEDWGYPTDYVRKLQMIIVILGGLLILCLGLLYIRRKK